MAEELIILALKIVLAGLGVGLFLACVALPLAVVLACFGLVAWVWRKARFDD